jgi:hypothetical protein
MRGIPNRSPLVGIYRRERGRKTDWSVFIKRDGRSLAKSFSDRRYGSKAAALLAAQRYRDKLLKENPPLSKRAFCMKVKRSNTSGVAGVWREVRSNGYARWVANTALASGRRLLETFSVDRHGEAQAKDMATAARMRQLEQVSGSLYFSPDLPRMMARLERVADPLQETQGLVGRKGTDASGITREAEGKDDPAWRASVSWNGKALQKRFSDRRFGGEEAALVHAVVWRDRILDPGKPQTVMEFAAVKHRNNTSGVSGVHRQREAEVRRDGTLAVRHYWCARIPDGVGGHRGRSFCIEKYGEREAYRRAVEARMQGLAKLQMPLHRQNSGKSSPRSRRGRAPPAGNSAGSPSR